ncbi:MAG: thiolase family protein [Bacilli bacterium]
MKEIVITEALRTPIGTLGGSLKDVLVDELSRAVVKGLIERSQLNPISVNQMIWGHAKQCSDTPNLARLVCLQAGLPVETSAYTVQRQCGSGMQAVINAFQELQFEDGIIVAGGAESMSTAPYYIRQARYGYGAGNGLLLDPNTESQPRSQPSQVYGELTMGMTAENLAERYGISREEQDKFSLNSQSKALEAIKLGYFRDEIVPVIVKKKKDSFSFDTDEFPRVTSLQQLSALKPVFKVNGTVTAGSSSGRNDGAAGMLVMTKDKANQLGMKPMVRIVSYGVSGVSPEMMGIGPVLASKIALQRAGLSISDIGLIELNEAFAAQSLAVLEELKVDPAIVNVHGGAIALGHPIGCSGARVIVTLLHAMKLRDVQYGLATLCIAGGMGIAMVVENLNRTVEVR